MLKETDQS